MFKLHPKIKAALITALGVVAASIAAWANGSVSSDQAISTSIAGLLVVLVGYLKGDTPAAPGE